MKAEEDGLAYGSSISSDSSLRLLRYYAGRSPDVASLIDLVNSIVTTIPQFQDDSLIDYALEGTFSTSKINAYIYREGYGDREGHSGWQRPSTGAPIFPGNPALARRAQPAV